MPKEETQFTFEDQRPDEEVIFVKKRHPWFFAKAGFMIIIFIIILVIAILIWGFSAITSILILVFIVFTLLYGFNLWFLYNNFLYILTDQRLIMIEQRNIFSRRINETELEKIQNIIVEVKGIIKTFLNFGDIKITTAGVDLTMKIENIENPYDVQQQIAKYSKKMNAPVRQDIKPIIR